MSRRSFFSAICILAIISLPLSLCASDTLVMLDKKGIRPAPDDHPATAARNAAQLNTLLKRYAGSGKWLVLPPGTTWIAEPLLIPSGTRLQGHPSGSTISISKHFVGLQEGFVVNTDFVLYTSNQNKEIFLRDLTLDANNVTPASGQPRGFFMNKVQHLQMINLQVVNTAAEAIRVDVTNAESSTKNVLINGCTVQLTQLSAPAVMVRSHTRSGNNAEKEPTRTSNVAITQCRVLGGSHNIMLFNVADALISNNQCERAAQRGIILSPTCAGISVTNNRVQKAGSTGIHVAYHGTDIRIDSNVVSGTVADQSGIGIEGQGIKAYAGFQRIRIRYNECFDNATDGIALEGGGTGEDFIIESNYCHGNKRNGIRLMAGALTIDRPTDLSGGTVQQNRLLQNAGSPIFIGSDNKGQNKVRRTLVKNNQFGNESRKKVETEYVEGSNSIEDNP